MMQSPQMPYRTALFACAAFFAGPGIFYGMLTSRMPALKAQAGVSEGEIGLLLLSLGLSALVMLLMSSLLVTKFGSRRVLGWGSLVCMAGIPVAAFAADFWVLWGAFILFGFGMGLWDVSMNVQGMGVERRYGKSSMLILHASYSTGSVIGAASGAFFAAAELAVPDRQELQKKLQMMQASMQQSVQKSVKLGRQRLSALAEKRVLQSPLNYLEDRRVLLDFLSTRLQAAEQKTLHESKQRFVRLTAALDAMSPLKVLSRGYSMVTDESGKLVTSASTVRLGQRIHISLRSG